MCNFPRYLIYLQRNRNLKPVVAHEPDLSTDRISESEKQISDMEEEEEIFGSDRHSHMRSRRGTLSPRSAKQMMLEVIDDDCDDLISTDDPASPFSIDSVVMDKKNAENTDSEASDVEPIVVEVCESEDTEIAIIDIEAVSNAECTTNIEIKVDFTPESGPPLDTTNSVDDEDSRSLTSPSLSRNEALSTSYGSSPVNKIEVASDASDSTAAIAEERARERYMFRMQQAEWKYLWEIASYEAASRAVKITNRR